MPYVGRSTDKLSNVEVLDNITFDGSSSYTLQKGGSNFTPSSANTLLVSIDGVVQAGNFTVSGSTIDFGTAVAGTSTCDFILHYGTGLITTPADGTVTTAKIGSGAVTTAKIADANVTSAKMFSTFKNGITQTDTWRLTTTTNESTNDAITTNWEKSDDPLFGYIGNGLTESSGVFSFPETGLYYIHYSFCIQTNDDTSAGVILQTTDNNSTFADRGEVFAGAVGASASNHTVSNANFLNVTDITNIKFKFKTVSFSTGTGILGNSSENRSGFSILRIGDTV